MYSSSHGDSALGSEKEHRGAAIGGEAASVPVDRPGRRSRVGSLIARQSGGGEGGGEGSGEGGSAQGRGEASGGKGGGEVGGRAPLPTCRSPSMKIRSPKSPRRKLAPGFRHGLVIEHNGPAEPRIVAGAAELVENDHDPSVPSR